MGRVIGWLGPLLIALGALALCAGAWWVYPPAGLILAGLLLAAAGLFADFERWR